MPSASDPRYRITYTGGGSPPTRRDTLTAGGQLRLLAAHILVLTLPLEYVDDVGGGNFEVSQHLCEELMNDLLEWEPALFLRDLLWVTHVNRFARFLYQAEETGRWIVQRCKRVLQLKEQLRVCVSSMAAHDRELNVTDTIAYTHGVHASFFTRLTPRAMAGAVSSAETACVAMRAKSLFAQGYVAADRVANGFFADLLELVLHCAGDNLAGASESVQASAVRAWLRRTSPEADGSSQLWVYLRHDQQEREIERRRGSETERFKLLFIPAWDAGVSIYGNVALAFPRPASGTEIFELLRILGSRAGMASDLTAPVVMDINGRLANALHHVDTPSLRTADNDVRAQKLGPHLISSTATHSTVGEDDTAAAVGLHANADFKSLSAVIEALDVLPLQLAAIATAAAGHVHPFGLQFLSTGGKTQKLFRNMAGARSSATLDDAYNAYMVKALVKDPTGSKYIAAGVAMKLVQGKFDRESGFCLYKDLVKPFVSRRDGAHLLVSESDDSGTFWSDLSRLNLSEAIIIESFVFIGYTERTRAGSLPSFLSGMRERATSLKALRPTYRKKKGLTRQLHEAGDSAFSSFAVDHRAMLIATGDKAARPPDFVSTGSDTNRLLTEWDADMAKAKDEEKFDRLENEDDDDGGSAAGSSSQHNKPRRDDEPPSDGAGGKNSKQALAIIEQLTGKKGGNAISAVRAQLSSGSAIVPRSLSFGDTTPIKDGVDWKQYVGYAAWDYGIYTPGDYEGVIFGACYLVYQEGWDIANLDGMCLACIAPPMDPNTYHGLPLNYTTRYLWCTHDCGVDTHRWPDGSKQQDWKVINLYSPKTESDRLLAVKVLLARSSWKLIYPNTGKGDKTKHSATNIASCMNTVPKAVFDDPTLLEVRAAREPRDRKGKGGGGKIGKGGKGEGGKGDGKQRGGKGKGGKGDGPKKGKQHFRRPRN